jgi:hypothetical protein
MLVFKVVLPLIQVLLALGRQGLDEAGKFVCRGAYRLDIAGASRQPTVIGAKCRGVNACRNGGHA